MLRILWISRFMSNRWNLRDIDMNDYIESHEDSENGDYDFDDNFI